MAANGVESERKFEIYSRLYVPKLTFLDPIVGDRLYSKLCGKEGPIEGL